MRISALLLCTLAAGQQFPLLNSQHANITISKPLFDELEELSRIVDISYCVGSPAPGIQRPFECPSRCKEFEGFELVTTWNTGPLLSDSCGYIALSHAPNKTRLILAFRGTYSITNTIADLSTIPQEYVPYPGDEGDPDPGVPKCDQCAVHMGFHKSWENTREVVVPIVEAAMKEYPDYDLILVGHSLGGAVAALAGLELLARDLNPTVTTFGEPRLGNQAFCEYFDARFNLAHNSTSRSVYESSTFRRVTHVNDPVPLLPLEEWGYRPHGGEIFISASGLPPEINDVYHCVGPNDKSCSDGPHGSWSNFPWGVPTRYRIWQLFFAHRDYFWRLGLCVPDGKWFWHGNEQG